MVAINAKRLRMKDDTTDRYRRVGGMTHLRDRASAMFVYGCLLVLLAGCGGKTVSASSQDQAFTPGQTAETKSEPAQPPQEEVRVAEPPPPPLEPPKEAVQKEAVQEAAAPPPTEPPSLADIFFDFDRFAIREDARGLLEGDARLVKAETDLKKDLKLMIEGYCDERGTLEYNLVLGERRAKAVKQYLQDLGIPASRMQVTSYGKEKPFCSEHSYECWQKNRRAHLLMQ
jgi:peptidoglycan-associated lipoprotein